MSRHSILFYLDMKSHTKRGAIYMTATRGLEGVVATESAISSIIDDTLTYVGYDIDDLSR